MRLRRWQAEALGEVAPRIRPGFAEIMSVCTRAGKSVFMAALAKERRDLTIDIVTSRTRLVDDLVDVCRGVTGEPVGRFDGFGKREGRVRVTTYPSLAAALDVRRADLVMCDEAHHTGSPGVVALLGDAPMRLGLTATPYRGAVRATLPLFDGVAYRLTLKQAMEDGIIVPFRPWWPTGTVEEMSERASLEVAAAEVERRGGPRVCGPLLVTAPDIGAAMGGAAWLRTQGWRAEATGSHLSRREQDALLNALRARELDALVFVDLLTEGVTVPCARGLILAAGIGSSGRVRLAQLVGRVLGAEDAPPVGCAPKTEAVIYDPTGVLHRHRLESAAAFGEEEARAVKVYKTPTARAKAAIRGLDAYPRSLAFAELDAWILMLGSELGAEVRQPPERYHLPATEGQRANLRRLLKGRAVALVQGPDMREYLRQLPDAAALTLGAGSVLTEVVYMLRARQRAWLAATEGSPWSVRQRRQAPYQVDLSTWALPGLEGP